MHKFSSLNAAISMKVEPLNPLWFERQSNCFVGQCRRAVSKVKIDQYVNETAAVRQYVNDAVLASLKKKDLTAERSLFVWSLYVLDALGSLVSCQFKRLSSQSKDSQIKSTG